MGKAVIVFSFPEPDDPRDWSKIITKSKRLFENIPEIQAYAAVNDAADSIINILTPEVKDDGLLPEDFPSGAT